MRAKITGMGVQVDLIPNADEAIRVVRTALEAGLPNLFTEVDASGYVVTIRLPEGAFAADALAAMVRVVEAVNHREPAPVA